MSAAVLVPSDNGISGVHKPTDQVQTDEPLLQSIQALYKVLSASRPKFPHHIRQQMIKLLKNCLQMLLVNEGGEEFQVSRRSLDYILDQERRLVAMKNVRSEHGNVLCNSLQTRIRVQSEKLQDITNRQVDTSENQREPAKAELRCFSQALTSKFYHDALQSLADEVQQQQQHDLGSPTNRDDDEGQKSPSRGEDNASPQHDKRRVSEDDIRQARNPCSKKTRSLFATDMNTLPDVPEKCSIKGSASTIVSQRERQYTSATYTTRQAEQVQLSLNKVNRHSPRGNESPSSAGDRGKLQLIGQISMYDDYELPFTSRTNESNDITGVQLDPHRNILYVCLAKAGVVQLDASALSGSSSLSADDLIPKGMLRACPEGRVMFCMEIDNAGKQTLLCGDSMGGIQHFDVESGMCTRYVEHRTSKVLSLDYLPNSYTEFASCSEGVVNLWDIRDSASRVSLLDMGDKQVTSIRVNPDNQHQIVVGASDRFAYLFDTRKALVAEDATGSYRCLGGVSHVAFPSNDEVMCSSSAGQLRLFDMDRQSCLRVYSGHYGTSRFTGLAVNPSGEVYACGGGNHEVVVYHRTNPKPFARYSFSPPNVQEYYVKASKVFAQLEDQGFDDKAMKYGEQLRLLQNRFSVTALTFAHENTLLCGTSKGAIAMFRLTSTLGQGSDDQL